MLGYYIKLNMNIGLKQHSESKSGEWQELINDSTFRYMQRFQRGSRGTVQQSWPAVRSFLWCRRWFRCYADWRQTKSILWLSICTTSILPGARLRAADTHSAPGAIWELWWHSAEIQEWLVLDLSRGRCSGGGILLRGVGRQRLQAAHGSATWTAAKRVTYTGTRKEASEALIKTCWVKKPLWLFNASFGFPFKNTNNCLMWGKWHVWWLSMCRCLRNIKGHRQVLVNYGMMACGGSHCSGAHFLHQRGTVLECRGCGASWVLWSDRWPCSCESQVGSGVAVGAHWGPEPGGRSGGPCTGTN